MSKPGLLIWVQHLFGRGHVQRMAHIAQACAADGFDVTVLAGGPNGRRAFTGIDHVSAHQMPALRTKDHQYTGLLTDRGEAPSEAFWEMRQEVALEVLRLAKPEFVLMELFPFGRRKFASEALALISTARELSTPPRIVSSVRDIVEPKADPEKAAEMAGWLEQHFHAVLVHGDKSVIELKETAPFVATSKVPLHYTGYVGPEDIDSEGIKSGVVVSAGSGLSGDGLLKIAAEAGTRAATEESPWHIFVPPSVEAPSSGKNPYVFVHPFGSSFSHYMAKAEVSISEAGYNTAVEALKAGATPVLVPYGEAGQTEQPLRARRFAKHGLAIAPEPGTLDPLRMIEAVEAARSLPDPRSTPGGLNLDGTSQVPMILKGLREGGQAF